MLLIVLARVVLAVAGVSFRLENFVVRIFHFVSFERRVVSLCICCQIRILVQGSANTRTKYSLVALVGHQLVLLGL